MDFNEFSRRLGGFRSRLDGMRGEDGSARVAIEELDVAWEELHVAEEELRQQGEELDAAQAALLTEQARYRDLFNAAPVAYVVTDGNGCILEANRAAVEGLRTSEGSLVGKPLLVFVPPEQRRAFRSLLVRLPQVRRVAVWETLIQPRQAPAWPASVSVAVRDAGGGAREIRWLLRDVSEDRRLRDELCGLNETLEARVRARTIELEEKAAELEAALRRETELRSRAEEADRAREAFLGNVSHELRTPLSALLGWTHVLLHSSPDETGVRRAHAAIERSARAQIKLVDDILDASRMLAGKLQLDKEAIDFSQAVSAAVLTLRPSVEGRSIALETIESPEPLPVLADPDRLQQVIWNLVSNAIKFTPTGGRIEVRTERIGDEAVLSVMDTGAGIEPEFLPRVFERFSQADRSLTRAHGGLGLGLAIARHIVLSHGGTIAAASAGRGQGATFRVTVPVDFAAPRAATPGAGTAEPAAGRADGRLRVLVVDDDADTREALVATLGSFGFQAAAAASVDEALERLRGHVPDVVVSDIGMPGKDGYALLGAMRGLSVSTGAIPVVALTGYAEAVRRSDILRAGFREVTKPVAAGDLHRVLRDVARPTRTETP
jgi:PAS domain S-box-containing protein